MDVREDDEPVAPLQDSQRVRCICERGPERHRCAERLIQHIARLEAQALRHAPVDFCEEIGVAKPGRGVLVVGFPLREGGECGPARHRRVAATHDERLQRIPDAGLPVDEGA